MANPETFVLEVQTGDVVEAFELSRELTVIQVKEACFQLSSALQGYPAGDYILAASASDFLTTPNLKFVESHPSFLHLISEGQRIRVWVIPNPDLPQVPELPPRPKSMTEPMSSYEIILPNGATMTLRSSPQSASSVVQEVFQQVHQLVEKLPQISDIGLTPPKDAADQDPVQYIIKTSQDGGVPQLRVEATKKVTRQRISQSEFERLQKENRELRELNYKLERERGLSMATSVETQGAEGTTVDEVPPEERVRLPVQIVFPRDFAVMLEMSVDLPVWAAKAWAWRVGTARGLLEHPLEHHELLDGTHCEEDSESEEDEEGAPKQAEEPIVLLDETLTLKNLAWPEDEDGVVRGVLHIKEKEDMVKKKERDKAEKKLGVHIGSLIGRPLCWTSGDDEVSHFRHHISKVVSEELEKGSLQEGMINVNANLVLTDKPPYIPEKFPVRFRLQGTDATKMMLAYPNDTPPALAKRALPKFRGMGLPEGAKPEDYIIKVGSRTEYVDGDVPLHSAKFVRETIKRKAKVDLVLVPRKILQNEEVDPRTTDKSFFRDWHDARHEAKPDSITLTNRAWDEMMVISTRDLKKQFRIRVVGIDQANYEQSDLLKEAVGDSKKKDQKWEDFVSHVYVSVAVCHGGALCAPEIRTAAVPRGTVPRWNEVVTAEIEVARLPRESRLCVTFWGKLVEGASKKEGITEVPLGWVNLQLIDYRNHLVSGAKALKLWWDGPANRIGTCQPNVRSNKPAIVSLEFEAYALPVVFPDDPTMDSEMVGVQVREPNAEEMAKIKFLFNTDPLYTLTKSDRELLISYRHFLKKTPKALPKFLNAVTWSDPEAVAMAHQMLVIWAPMTPADALELLDARFADHRVRQYAVQYLEGLSDGEICDYLLQLIQVIKYEPYHISPLAEFLIRRALQNRIQVGHQLFWQLKGEMHVPEINERYGLMLESYLRGCGSHLKELEAQTSILKQFVAGAEKVKDYKLDERKPVIQEYLRTEVKFPERALQMPLDPGMEVKGLRTEKCKSMDSKKVPLWLVFQNADPVGDDLFIMFKSGDDLRQDMLTLQLIRIMDKIWQTEGLDLFMSPYGCVSTGDEEGMLELVLNADTTANITKEAGGATAAFSATPLANWLREYNPSDQAYAEAVDLFCMSCAGYCVASYVLGIGDRHNDNVMLKKNGQLFHIDFGHFLGNIKKWKGISRERAPFVFTPDFAYIMGGKDSPKYGEFVKYCCRAYNIVRKHAHLFFNLFALMLSTGIPELQSAEDLNYLREAFSLDLNDEDASKRFTGLIEQSLKTKATQINNAIHIMAHS